MKYTIEDAFINRQTELNVCLHRNCFNDMHLDVLLENNIFDDTVLTEELNNLVQYNFLAFHPEESTYQLQGNTMFYGLKL